MNRLDRIVFHIGTVIWLPLVVGGSLFSRYLFPVTKEYVHCSFKKATGFPCPGCGGTRAVIRLFQGKLFESLCFHPAVLCGVLLYIHFMLVYSYWNYIKKNPHHGIRVPNYAYVFIAVIIIQWMIKLILRQDILPLQMLFLH